MRGIRQAYCFFFFAWAETSANYINFEPRPSSDEIFLKAISKVYRTSIVAFLKLLFQMISAIVLFLKLERSLMNKIFSEIGLESIMTHESHELGISFEAV